MSDGKPLAEPVLEPLGVIEDRTPEQLAADGDEPKGLPGLDPVSGWATRIEELYGEGQREPAEALVVIARSLGLMSQLDKYETERERHLAIAFAVKVKDRELARANRRVEVLEQRLRDIWRLVGGHGDGSRG